MRTIEQSSTFKWDYKREMKGQCRAVLENDLPEVLMALAQDQPLVEKSRDHLLVGDWMDHRECHITTP